MEVEQMNLSIEEGQPGYPAITYIASAASTFGMESQIDTSEDGRPQVIHLSGSKVVLDIVLRHAANMQRVMDGAIERLQDVMQDDDPEEEDEEPGEHSVFTGASDGRVVVQFKTPLSYIEMTPDEAEKLAEVMRHWASVARSQKT